MHHTIRLATEADLIEIVAMLADDDLGRAREAPGNTLDPAYLKAFRDMQSTGMNFQLVAQDGAGLVGCLQLTFIRGLSRRGALRAQIEGVRVARRARGRGIGRTLVSSAIARARDAGCTLVQLTSDKRRIDAHRFYETLGFVASHEGMKLALPD